MLNAEEVRTDPDVALDDGPVHDGSPGRTLDRRHAGGDVEWQRRVVLHQPAHLKAVAEFFPQRRGRRHRGIERAVQHEAVPLVVVGAPKILGEIKGIDRRAEEELADVVRRL
jgi:hypothetical protein